MAEEGDTRECGEDVLERFLAGDLAGVTLGYSEIIVLLLSCTVILFTESLYDWGLEGREGREGNCVPHASEVSS